jgi:dihydrolipoamide dehydrogenase
VPERLVVVGAGYIGLEMGSVWSRLGSSVTVVEFLDNIVPNVDLEVAKHFHRNLQKQGLNFMLGTKVIQADLNDKGVALLAESVNGGRQQKIDCDVLLVAVGRKPSTDNLGLEELGVKRDKNGFLCVNDKLETSVANILAIGDCIPGPMLAHKAEEDGVAAVEMIAGGSAHIDHNLVPSIIYTHPEVASVGKTEEHLKSQNIDYNVGKFPFSANSRARANDDTNGFVKILADSVSDQILGVHIIGPEAGTLIHECATAMVYGASAEDIARTCHGHPTLNEAIKEAALAVDGRPIHI